MNFFYCYQEIWENYSILRYGMICWVLIYFGILVMLLFGIFKLVNNIFLYVIIGLFQRKEMVQLVGYYK